MGNNDEKDEGFIKERYSYDKDQYDKYTKNSANPNLTYTDALATKVKPETENLKNPSMSYTDTLANPNNVYTDNLKGPYDPYANLKKQNEIPTDDLIEEKVQIEKETNKQLSTGFIILISLLLLATIGALIYFIL